MNSARKKIICVCANPAVDSYLTIDEMKSGQLNRISNEKHFAGGKGIHVALAAKELGEEVIAFAFWAGATGNFLKEKLRGEKISCGGVEVEGWNRINYTFRSQGEWNETELVAPGPEISSAQYKQFIREFEKLLPQACAVVISGSTPPGVPTDAYGALIDAANSYSLPVWIDCSGKLFEDALLHRPFGLHLNKHELGALTKKEFEHNPEKHFLRFAKQVALTAGEDGLYLNTAEGSIHAHCHLEKVFSAVGSGDCLTAGLAVAHLRNYSLKEAAQYATACGAANCIREDLGMLYRKDVEKLMKQVELS